jgi:hypothetical protein
LTITDVPVQTSTASMLVYKDVTIDFTAAEAVVPPSQPGFPSEKPLTTPL